MLSVENFNVFYGESHILHDLEFKLGEGESVAIMGRNGMGKTTLLKALIGMIPSRTGNIFLNSQNLAGTRSYRRVEAGFGYVPQGRLIFPYLTVEENILSGMDRILVFKEGSIIEEGSHSELLEMGGHYATMWEMQAGGFLPDVNE